MYQLRAFLFRNLFFPLLTVIWSLAICLMCVLPFRRQLVLSTYWGDSVLWLARKMVGINHEIHGLENIPKEGLFIIMANHQSTWETAFLPTLYRSHAWVLKKELRKIPIFGWALAALKPIAIDRSAGKEALKQVVEQGKDRLSSGRVILIFPEGTRKPAEAPTKFKIGGAILAAETGLFVIPIAHNAGQFWSRSGEIHAGTIQIVIGEPIETKGLKASEISRIVEAWVDEQRQKIVLAEKQLRGEA